MPCCRRCPVWWRRRKAELGARGSIGMAIPGTESFGNDLIKNANTTWLIGKPLRRDLEQVLGRDGAAGQ